MKKRRTQPASSLRSLSRLATALAVQGPIERLHESVVAAIRRRPAREPVAVACSGGADSVALLLLLWVHFPERRGSWLVLHFNHRLRGRASAGDTAFVRALARGLGERCETGHWRRARGTAKTGISEADARDARWRFFDDTMRAAGARLIALGHQLDDVAETMLMRLTRGSGTSGLAAPRPVQRMADGSLRVRPLLEWAADEVRDALRRAHVPWREDATNASDDYFRNRVRRRVLPALLAAADRPALVGFGAARAQLEEDDDALAAWLDELVAPPHIGEPYDLSALRRKPLALVRRAIHRWIKAIGLPSLPSKAVVARVAAAILEHRDLQLSQGSTGFIQVKEGCLAIVQADDPRERQKPWPTSRLEVDSDLTGPGGDRLTLRTLRPTPRLLARIRVGDFSQQRMAYLDPGAGWPGWLGVRAWKQGDRYRPLGAHGRSKLQDLFVNRRVPKELRSLLPVLVNPRGNVLWVPGLPVADEVAIQPAFKLVVQLTYTAAPPMVHRSIAHTSPDV